MKTSHRLGVLACTAALFSFPISSFFVNFSILDGVLAPLGALFLLLGLLVALYNIVYAFLFPILQSIVKSDLPETGSVSPAPLVSGISLFSLILFPQSSLISTICTLVFLLDPGGPFFMGIAMYVATADEISPT